MRLRIQLRVLGLGLCLGFRVALGYPSDAKGLQEDCTGPALHGRAVRKNCPDNNNPDLQKPSASEIGGSFLETLESFWALGLGTFEYASCFF